MPKVWSCYGAWLNVIPDIVSDDIEARPARRWARREGCRDIDGLYRYVHVRRYYSTSKFPKWGA